MKMRVSASRDSKALQFNVGGATNIDEMEYDMKYDLDQVEMGEAFAHAARHLAIPGSAEGVTFLVQFGNVVFSVDHEG